MSADRESSWRLHLINPLHQAALDPDEAWGEHLQVRCNCGHGHTPWLRKCPACRRKNPLCGIRKKSKRIESWLDRWVRSELQPELEKTLLLLESARQYDSLLTEVMRRPFPVRQRKENLDLFMRRVATYFPTMLKSTSPKQTAVAISDAVPRAAKDMARAAWTQCERILDIASGVIGENPVQGQLDQQAGRISEDLRELVTPYVEALRTLQLAHSRMVTAFRPTQPIFRREYPKGRIKGLWNKARSMMKSPGTVLRFPTAVWNTEVEFEELCRLDKTMAKFLEQAQRFQNVEQPKLAERATLLLNSYRLSLRRYLVCGLTDRALRVPQAERRLFLKRIRSQKGVGSWLWRWLFGLRGTQE